MIVLVSLSNFPASNRLTRSMIAWKSLTSLSLASMSVMCWDVRPSGSPDDPRGKVRKDHLTSSGSTWRGVNLVLLVESTGVRRLVAGYGCLPHKALSISSMGAAGLSSMHWIRWAALRFPASNLDRTAAARIWSSSFGYAKNCWSTNLVVGNSVRLYSMPPSA